MAWCSLGDESPLVPPKEHTQSVLFVVLSCGLVPVSFTHILQGYSTGTAGMIAHSASEVTLKDMGNSGVMQHWWMIERCDALLKNNISIWFSVEKWSTDVIQCWKIINRYEAMLKNAMLNIKLMRCKVY